MYINKYYLPFELKLKVLHAYSYMQGGILLFDYAVFQRDYEAKLDFNPNKIPKHEQKIQPRKSQIMKRIIKNTQR